MSAAALAAIALSLAAPDAVACASQPELSASERTYHGDVDYFPLGVVDALVCDWYSKHLHSLEEAPLTSDGAVFRLRFLELPTFDYPMSITVTHFSDGRAVIEARATNGLGGFEAGKLIYNQRAILSGRDLEFIVDEIANLQLCRDHFEDGAVQKEPDGRISATVHRTQNVFEWASGDIYCLRDAGAQNGSPLTKLAIWLVQRVFAFPVTPPPLRP